MQRERTRDNETRTREGQGHRAIQPTRLSSPPPSRSMAPICMAAAGPVGAAAVGGCQVQVEQVSQKVSLGWDDGWRGLGSPGGRACVLALRALPTGRTETGMKAIEFI